MFRRLDRCALASVAVMAALLLSGCFYVASTEIVTERALLAPYSEIRFTQEDSSVAGGMRHHVLERGEHNLYHHYVSGPDGVIMRDAKHERSLMAFVAMADGLYMVVEFSDSLPIGFARISGGRIEFVSKCDERYFDTAASIGAVIDRSDAPSCEFGDWEQVQAFGRALRDNWAPNKIYGNAEFID